MNNHARTDRKKKVLKLKAFARRVIEQRNKKLLKATKPKGKTIVGKLEKFENYVPYTGPHGYYKHLHTAPKGQRKIRKLARQMQRKIA